MKVNHKRIVIDAFEQQLLDDGWKFAGLALFSHPAHPHMYFSKIEATAKNELERLNAINVS